LSKLRPAGHTSLDAIEAHLVPTWERIIRPARLPTNVFAIGYSARRGRIGGVMFTADFESADVEAFADEHAHAQDIAPDYAEPRDLQKMIRGSPANLDVLKFHRLAAINATRQSRDGKLPGRIGGILATVRLTRAGALIAQGADLDDRAQP
jgi:hypothetical protein